MNRATLGTRLLSLALPKPHASALAGDLLELYPALWRFTCAVLATYLRLAWRTLTGLALAYASFPAVAHIGMHSVTVLNARMTSPPAGSPAKLTSQADWGGPAALIYCLALLLTPSALYALVRFGPRRPVAQVSLLLSSLFLVACWLMWLPAARIILVASFGIAIAMCLVLPRHRMALTKLSGALIIVALLDLLCLFILNSSPFPRWASPTLLAVTIFSAPALMAWLLSFQPRRNRTLV